MTGESWNNQQFNYFEETDQIYIGNGEDLEVLGSSSCLKNRTNPNLSLYLHNLLHDPQLPKICSM